MDSKRNVAIVIPYYHSDLNELEKVSFNQCMKILKDYTIILVVKNTLSETEYPAKGQVQYEIVPESWMESVYSYNRMMLDYDFYIRFKQYEYILIYQLDAFVFKDSLMEFCDMDYDYIGAPWLGGHEYGRNIENCVRYVGNGGLSLRKVNSMLNILKQCKIEDNTLYEDMFWAGCASETFKVAPVKIAMKFSAERNARKIYRFNGNSLPFGCHAWEKYDWEFWKPFFEEQGHIIETKIEGDLDIKKPEKKVTLAIDKDVWLKAINSLVGDKEWDLYVFGTDKNCEYDQFVLRHTKIPFKCIDNNYNFYVKSLFDIKIEPAEILLEKSDRKKVIILFRMKRRDEIFKELLQQGFKYGKQIFFYEDIWEKVKEFEGIGIDKQEYKQQKKESFQHLKNKKIVLYGTGVIAKRLLEALEEYQIVGILDKILVDGEIGQHQILQLEKLNKNLVDVIIIASNEIYYEDIYQRIVKKLKDCKIDIYGENGRKLMY